MFSPGRRDNEGNGFLPCCFRHLPDAVCLFVCLHDSQDGVWLKVTSVSFFTPPGRSTKIERSNVLLSVVFPGGSVRKRGLLLFFGK